MNASILKRCLNHAILLKSFTTFFLPVIFSLIFSSAMAQSPVRSKLAIQLLLNTEPGPHNTADGVVAFYADNFSTSIGNEDSYKMTNPDENLAIDCKGTLLSMEGRPTIHIADTLQLVMWTFRQKSYYLKLNGADFSAAVKAVVKDNYLHKETAIDLSSSTLVPFDITADSGSFSKDRFSVIFRTTRVFSLSGAMKMASVFKGDSSLIIAPNPVTGNVINLQFNNLEKGRYTANLFDSEGQLVYSGFIDYNGNTSKQTISIDKRLHKGVYNLFLACGAQAITRQVVFQ